MVAANAYGIDVILLFNKMDLLNVKQKLEQEKFQNIYKNIGYHCLALSVINDDLSDVKCLMKRKVNMISGHSGVGKSTLINKLQPDLGINTRNLSKVYRRGQHTTTSSELYNLDFGASIIDTPGIKGFGLVEFDINEIRDYFPEFLDLKKDCKFHNCIHKEEPHCAVKNSLKRGEISASRYNNYLKMLVEDDGFRHVNY